MNFRVLDLFSGIGGFSLGLEWAGGFEVVAFCEREEYPKKILEKHWPGVPIYEDVRDVTKQKLEEGGIFPDVITAGFPCQDISVAGKQEGIKGRRSVLWSELARVIGEVRPRYAIVENVAALISGDKGRWFGRVLADLAEVGYDTEWHCIPASALGAHHHRDRVWIICYPQHFRRYGSENKESDKEREGSNKKGKESASEPKRPSNPKVLASAQEGVLRTPRKGLQRWDTRPSEVAERLTQEIWDVEPDVGRVANGIPFRVDRLKGLGNAVVPQIPMLIGQAILDYEKNKELEEKTL